MKVFKFKVLACFILFLQANQAISFPETNLYVNNRGNIDISGPADSRPFGSVISNTGSTVYNICNSTAVSYTLSSVEYEPIAIWTGKIFQSSASHAPIPLFNYDVEGLSLTPMGGNTDAGFPANYSPLYTENKIVWSGTKGNDLRISTPHRVTIGAYIYKDEIRLTGTTALPQKTMYRYLCKDASGTTHEAYNVIIRPINLTGTVTGCTPANKTVVLEMDKIAIGALEYVDSSALIGTKSSTFSLQCDPNINVSVSFVDLSDQTNTSDTARLTNDSTASGVGFAITGTSGRRLQFGPDGSAANVPGQTKYYLQNSGTVSASQNNLVSTQFRFSYVRNQEQTVKAGTAKAIIGITYSYQ